MWVSGRNTLKEFNEQWELKGWLQPTHDHSRAYCKLCKADMRAHKSDIKKHSATAKHLKNIKAVNKQPNIRTAVATKSNKVSQLEITLAMHVACQLYQHVQDFFKAINIDLGNCIAMGTNGAANLCGRHHSLYALMKKDFPNLTLVKCLCHSLHLACSHASEELPSTVEYLLRETFCWFSRSSLRQQSYMDMYKLISNGQQPLHLIPLSATRWLARSRCVKRILDQWESLKLHFQIASTSCDKYVSRQLHAMYSDHVNELYLTFLKPLLCEFKRFYSSEIMLISQSCWLNAKYSKSPC